LFQLLVANRDHWLHRDQIVNMLWSDQSIENPDNYLKVILNTLNQVLEPDRPKGESSFFVERQQDRYRLNPKARIVIDADLFTKEVAEGTKFSLTRAINLYQGRFFAGNFIQEWLTVDEQYYHQQFILAAEKLTEIHIKEKEYQQALEITYKMLNEDILYEPTYRLQMTIFSEMGNISLVKETYKRCQTVFQEQLGSQISENTIKHYEKLIKDTSVVI